LFAYPWGFHTLNFGAISGGQQYGRQMEDAQDAGGAE
jgi:hypothetical protein